jgi:hypothetical protein
VYQKGECKKPAKPLHISPQKPSRQPRHEVSEEERQVQNQEEKGVEKNRRQKHQAQGCKQFGPGIQAVESGRQR